MEYLILIIQFVLFFLIRINKNKNKKIYSFILLLGFSILVLYSGFREFILPENKIGKDYFQYKFWFFSKNNINITEYSNIGFILLIKILNSLNLNYISLFFVSSFIIILGVYNFIIKNSKYYEISIYIYITLGLLLSGFNVIRQWMACSIFLIAWEFIKKRDFKRYFIYILIASLFHASALFLLLVYPMLNCNFKFKKRIIIILILTMLMMSSEFTLELLSKASIIDRRVYNRYASGMISSQFNYTIFCISMMNLAIILCNFKKYKTQNQYWNMELNYLLLLCAFAFVAPTHIIYSRAIIYFMPALLITIPKILDLVQAQSRKLIYFCMLIVFIIPYIS